MGLILAVINVRNKFTVLPRKTLLYLLNLNMEKLYIVGNYLHINYSNTIFKNYSKLLIQKHQYFATLLNFTEEEKL